MKRKLLLAVLAIVMTLFCAVGLAACDLFGEETSHKHQMQHLDAVAATCTEEGNTEYWVCADCGKYFSDADGDKEIADLNSTVISAKGHDWSEWETAKAATCTEDGYKERECSVCHETEREPLSATGHTFSEDWSYDGTHHWHICLDCDEIKDKAEHAWEEGVVTKQPSCTEDGITTYTCTVCEETKTVSIPATGHTFSKDWSHDGTYHWHAATCEHSDQVSDKAEHSWDNGVVTKQPTCTEDGIKTYTCTVCERTKTAVIPATGHTFSEDWSHDETYHWHACLNCGDAGEKTEHTFKNDICSVCNAPKQSVGLQYSLNNDGQSYSVTGIGTCTDTEIIIPYEYNGLPVTSIGYAAFEGCSSLTSVTIPDSVTIIVDYAFSGCSSLTNITISDSVTSIGDSAFSSCSSITSITIPDSVTSIEGGTFSNCSSLTRIAIPDSVTSIGSNMFYNCNMLTDVTIGNGVKSIGEAAFLGCCSLTSVSIPHGVTSIGEYAFFNCNSLTSITIPDSVTSIGSEAFSGCNSLESTTLPAFAISYIPRTKLKTVVITSGESIEEGAFASCSSLTSITLPNSVTSIGNYAFKYCSSLTSVTIPDSVISIGEETFYYCSGLTDVTIGRSVASIGDYAFSNCGSLEKVFITDIAAWCKISFSKYNSTPLYNGCELYLNGEIVTNLVIPDSATSIENFAFSGCSSITSITIPYGVTNIGVCAFYNCDSLTSITLPDSVTTIKSEAFLKCSSLTSVIIPNSVTSIGDSAFSNCSSLTSITLPDSLTSIGSSAFLECSSLTSVIIPNSVKSIGGWTFYNCSSLTSITLPFVGASKDETSNTHFGYIFGARSYSYNSEYVPKSLKTVIISGGNSIGDFAFSGCSSITSISIPDGVTSIGSAAFEGCTLLTRVTIGNGLTSIGDYAFSSCRSLTSITLPDSVISIGNSAFEGCSSLTSITISDSLMSIGIRAFYGCSSLTSITIPDGVTSIGNEAFYDCTKLVEVYNLSSLDITKSSSNGYVAYYALNVYTAVEGQSKLSTTDDGYIFYEDGETVYLMGYKGTQTELTLPDTFNGKNYKLYNYAFAYCSSLTSITIPNGVASIVDDAFKYCSSLTSVTIPDGVTSIGWRAFYGCSSLTSITIPDGVTSIGNYAFTGCSSLEAVFITDIAAWCEISFFDGSSNPLYYGAALYLNGELVTELVIPDSVTNIEHYAFYGCSSLTDVTIGNGVTSIGNAAFSGCDALSEINVSANNEYYSSQDGVLFNKDKTTLICYPSGIADTNYNIPDSVTSIGDYAFYNCSSLTSITIPDSVTSIGDYAFYNCSSLTSIIISDSVTSIGSWAFAYCRSLTSITIPDSVTSIGSLAFAYCRSLESVTFENTSGWWVSDSSIATSGTSISESDLADPSTAATYLTSTYYDYYWERS